MTKLNEEFYTVQNMILNFLFWEEKDFISKFLILFFSLSIYAKLKKKIYDNFENLKDTLSISTNNHCSSLQSIIYISQIQCIRTTRLKCNVKIVVTYARVYVFLYERLITKRENDVPNHNTQRVAQK